MLYDHWSGTSQSINTNTSENWKSHDTDTITNLQEELANINISDKLDHNTKSNPNKNYNIIDTIITSLITKHFPTKTVKFNKHKNNS